MGNAACTCECARGSSSRGNGPSQIIEPSLPPSGACSSLRSIDEFLAQYDGEHFVKEVSIDTVLGVSDKMNLVRDLATDKLFSCRRFPLDAVQLQKDELQQHFDRLRTLEHPHLAQFIDAFLTKTDLIVVAEVGGRQPLLKYIQNLKEFGERNVSICIRQLAMAISVAHENGFVHGHMTPWSVHVADTNRDESSFHLKLDSVGLGLSVLPSTLVMAFPSIAEDKEPNFENIIDKPELRHAHLRVAGSLAPEVLWGEVKCQKIGKSSPQVRKMDIWGLGVIAYYLLAGRLPFMPTVGQPLGEFLQARDQLEVSFDDDQWNSYPEVAKDCIGNLLRINAFLRPDASTVLKHPWIRLAKDKVTKAEIAGVLRNIFRNSLEGPLKRMVLRIIAHSHVSAEHRSTAERCFRFLDSSSDGLLGVKELIGATRKFLPRTEMSDADIDGIFKRIDKSGDGSLDFMEFLSVSLNSTEVLHQDQLLAVFRTFDTDGGGTITVDEIEQVARRLSSASDQSFESVESALADVKAEAGDGQSLQPIDFAEFVDLITMPASEAKAWWTTTKRKATRVMSIFGPSDFGLVRALDLEVPTVSHSVYAGRLRREISGEFEGESTVQNVPILGGAQALPMELPAPERAKSVDDAIFRQQSNVNDDAKARGRGRTPSQRTIDKVLTGIGFAKKGRSEERRKSKDCSPQTPLSDQRRKTKDGAPLSAERRKTKDIAPLSQESQRAGGSSPVPQERKRAKEAVPSSPAPPSGASKLTSSSPGSQALAGRKEPQSSKRASSGKSPPVGEQHRRGNVRRHTSTI